MYEMSAPKNLDKNLRWSRGDLEQVPACPACGRQERVGKALHCKAHSIELIDIWTMHKCANCRSLYLDPRPDSVSLPQAYEVYYTHQIEDEKTPDSGLTGLLWRLIHGYLNHRFGMNRQPASKWGVLFFAALPPFRQKLDYYGRHLLQARFPQRGRLLDIGCGNGAFLARAKEMGWNATGLDPDPEAVATCLQQGLDVVEGVLESVPVEWHRCFDVLTMSHAIEHVPKPLEDLQRAYSLLAPGGLIWLACPNPNALGARFYGASWRGLHAPYHLAIPSQKQLIKLVRAAGFTNIRLRRRGAHAKVILRESADIAHDSNENNRHLKVSLTPLLRLIADAYATISPNGGEETVLTAYRPANS